MLFARTAKNQTQTWQIIVQNDSYHTCEGLLGGAISVSKPTLCKAKNEGKANETTAEQQAYKDAKSKWQKKLDSGYHEDVANIDIAKFFEPMLAHKWSDYGDEVTYHVYSQAKLDGMRCLTTKDSMDSRGGKKIKSAPHILEALQPIFARFPDLVFDGELYNHAYKRDFNKIISLAKKSKPTQEDLQESKEKLEYWVYDMFDPHNPDKIFSERFETLKSLIKEANIYPHVRFVFTNKVEDKAALDTLYYSYVDDGFEGQMVRADAKYECKRTKSLLKRKDFMEREYPLWDVKDGDGNRAGLATIAYFKHDNGPEVHKGERCFKTGVIGDDKYSAELLADKEKYVGEPGTVRFFNLTPDGIPRFGKLKIMRDYE